MSQYLQAAATFPVLFYQRPGGIHAKLSQVVDHFAPQGLTLTGYLRAVLRKPSLFVQTPATVIANIESVVQHFLSEGLTIRDYLGAALKQPQLFYQAPSTIIGHVDLVIEMQRRGLIAFPRGTDASGHGPLAGLFAFLVERPMYFCLADDNYALRIRYAELSGERPAGTALLTRHRHQVERDVARLLGPAAP